MLEKFLHMSALFDIYGALLTDKQKRCLQMHLFDKLGLAARSTKEKTELLSILSDLLALKQESEDNRLNNIIRRISVLTNDSKEA